MYAKALIQRRTAVRGVALDIAEASPVQESLDPQDKAITEAVLVTPKLAVEGARERQDKTETILAIPALVALAFNRP